MTMNLLHVVEKMNVTSLARWLQIAKKYSRFVYHSYFGELFQQLQAGLRLEDSTESLNSFVFNVSQHTIHMKRRIRLRTGTRPSTSSLFDQVTNDWQSRFALMYLFTLALARKTRLCRRQETP